MLLASYTSFIKIQSAVIDNLFKHYELFIKIQRCFSCLISWILQDERERDVREPSFCHKCVRAHKDLHFFLIHTRDTVLLIAAPACVFLYHPGSWVSIRASLSWTSFARNYWIISDLIFQVLILNFKEHASWLFESPYFNLHIHWSILILAIIAELSGLDILFLFQQGRGPIFGLPSLSVNLLGTIGNVGTDHCHCWLICWSIVFHFIIPYTFEEKKCGGWVKIIVLEYYIHLLFFILLATPCTLKTWCISLSLMIIVLHGRCMVLLLYMYYNAWLIEAMATKCLSILFLLTSRHTKVAIFLFGTEEPLLTM